MKGAAAYGSLKVLSYVILLLMLLAIGYAGWISLTHWDGIGV